MERSLIVAVAMLSFVGLAHGVGANANCSTTVTCDSGLKCSATNKCLPLFGGTCGTVSDCYVMEAGNGHCTSMGCGCKTNYVTSYSLDACKVKAGSLNCTTTDQCTENSYCNTTTNTCVCNTGFSIIDNRCAKMVGTACGQSSECILRASCTASKCTCTSPYVADGTSCKASSGAGAIFGSILTMLAFFVTSRIV